MSIPRFEIRDTSNQEFRFNLIAANNEVLLTSETYTALSSAKDGIGAVRTAAQKVTANRIYVRAVAHCRRRPGHWDR